QASQRISSTVSHWSALKILLYLLTNGPVRPPQHFSVARLERLLKTYLKESICLDSLILMFYRYRRPRPLRLIWKLIDSVLLRFQQMSSFSYHLDLVERLVLIHLI